MKVEKVEIREQDFTCGPCYLYTLVSVQLIDSFITKLYSHGQNYHWTIDPLAILIGITSISVRLQFSFEK